MKRVLLPILSLMLVAAMFAGCAKGENNPSADTSAPVKQQTVKIFHHMSEEGKRKGLQAWTDYVEKNMPGTKFDVQAIDYSQYDTMLKTKIAAGDAPDVMFGIAGESKELVDAGRILDITGQPFLNNLSDVGVKSMTVNGKVYGLGVDVGIMGVFYNKDLFKNAGLEVPKTYSDFIKVCDTFKAQGIPPISHGFKDSWVAQVDFQSDFYSALKKMPTFFDDIAAKKKKFSDFPEFKSSLERFSKRLSYSSGDDFGTDYAKSLQLFTTGKAAMVLQGSWAISEIRENNPDGNFGFFVLPAYDVPQDNLLNEGLDDAFMISASTKVKDAALKLFEYAASSEGASAWVKSSGTISCVKDIKVEDLDPMASDIMAYIGSDQVINTGAFEEFSGQKGDVWLQYQEMFASKHDDIDKFITDLQNEFDSIP